MPTGANEEQEAGQGAGCRAPPNQNHAAQGRLVSSIHGGGQGPVGQCLHHSRGWRGGCCRCWRGCGLSAPAATPAAAAIIAAPAAVAALVIAAAALVVTAAAAVAAPAAVVAPAAILAAWWAVALAPAAAALARHVPAAAVVAAAAAFTAVVAATAATAAPGAAATAAAAAPAAHAVLAAGGGARGGGRALLAAGTLSGTAGCGRRGLRGGDAQRLVASKGQRLRHRLGGRGGVAGVLLWQTNRGMCRKQVSGSRRAAV